MGDHGKTRSNFLINFPTSQEMHVSRKVFIDYLQSQENVVIPNTWTLHISKLNLVTNEPF